MTELYLPRQIDYSNKRVAISLSGGINSAAVLCELSDHLPEYAPLELHLVYVHMREHSRDTFRFVADCIKFARSTVALWRKAMGIEWMNRAELRQAIPPAYTEFIGRQLMNMF